MMQYLYEYYFTNVNTFLLQPDSVDNNVSKTSHEQDESDEGILILILKLTLREQ